MDVSIVGLVSGLGWGYCIALRVGCRHLRQAAGEERSRYNSDTVSSLYSTQLSFSCFQAKKKPESFLIATVDPPPILTI